MFLSLMPLFALLIIGNCIANIACSFIFEPTPIAIVVIAIILIILIVIVQFRKTQVLLSKKVYPTYVFFAIFLFLDIYFAIIGLALLIYLQQVKAQQYQLDNNLTGLMYTQSSSLDLTQIQWLNLVFYLGNLLFLGLYLRQFFRWFWVNNHVHIYRYLKKRVPYLNQQLLKHLPIIPVTQQHLNSICCLCLENYQYDDQLAKLRCEHIFHRNCIRIWVVRSNACPLCRKRVIFY